MHLLLMRNPWEGLRVMSKLFNPLWVRQAQLVRSTRGCIYIQFGPYQSKLELVECLLEVSNDILNRL